MKEKKNSKKSVKPVDFLKKPFNKIVFNYSFEKNDNNINNNSSNSNSNSTTINKIKSYHFSLNQI